MGSSWSVAVVADCGDTFICYFFYNFTVEEGKMSYKSRKGMLHSPLLQSLHKWDGHFSAPGKVCFLYKWMWVGKNKRAGRSSTLGTIFCKTGFKIATSSGSTGRVHITTLTKSIPEAPELPYSRHTAVVAMVSTLEGSLNKKYFRAETLLYA